MAQHLARIHGTEEDKVNCPFYFKIGACRHGDKCSRLHHRPAFSPTLLIKHLYRHPGRQAELLQASSGTTTTTTTAAATTTYDEGQAREDFWCFFEDLYMELSKFGTIVALHVVDNVGDHMIGHVYVKYSEEEEASDALLGLSGRYYDGRQLQVEFSPVTEFREARCRDYDEGSCSRGGFCNFLHVKPVPLPLIQSLEDDAIARDRENERRLQEEEDKEEERRHRRSSKKRERERKKSSSSRSHRDRDRDDRDSSGKRRKRERRSRSRSRSYSRSRSRDRDD